MAADPHTAAVDARYRLQQPVIYTLRERYTALKGHPHLIVDDKGATHFILDEAWSSTPGKYTMHNVEKQPTINFEKRALSLHGTWVLTHGVSGKRVAEVKPEFLGSVRLNPLSKPTTYVYLTDGDSKADYVLRGDFYSKSYKILQLKGSAEVLVAKVYKKTLLQKLAPCTSPAAAPGIYHVHVLPGVDGAFAVGIALVIDDLYRP